MAPDPAPGLRAAVRRLVAARAAAPLPEDADRLALGDRGLGFDSVRLVELLLDCERELGLRFQPEMLGDPGLSIETLVDRASKAST